MRYPSTLFRFALPSFALILCVAAPAMAQTQTQGGWRRVGDAPPPATAPATSNQADRTDPAASPAYPQQDPTEPVDRSDSYGQQQQSQPQPGYVPQDATVPPATAGQSTTPIQSERPANTRPAYGLPATLRLQPGTYLMVRINQALSTDHNHVGDTFSGTLVQPVIVNGIVVAMRGQTVYGQVAVAEKQHSDRESQLGLELTGLTLADGTQLPIRSQLVTRQGPKTPGGIEAGTVVGTTAVGAAIGGAVGWGTGAAVGAGAGAIAGLAGVLLTHNHPTVLYPETMLTFQVTTAVAVSTLNAPQAFRFVGPEDYEQQGPQFANRPPRPGYPVAGPGYPVAGAGYYYGPGYYPAYPAYGYPYYWGPSVGVVIGGGWGGGHWGRFGRRW